jgi:hypothetical protein
LVKIQKKYGFITANCESRDIFPTVETPGIIGDRQIGEFSVGACFSTRNFAEIGYNRTTILKDPRAVRAFGTQNKETDRYTGGSTPKSARAPTSRQKGGGD